MADDKKPTQTEQKWGPLANAGYTIMPNILFERMVALGLDALDICILLHLFSYWREKNNLPFPSKSIIAAAIGVDPRTVQRRIAAMEGVGFIKREQRRTGAHPTSLTNRYHFDGLIAAATPYATEAIKERAIARAARAQRFNRKKPVKPKLTVV